MKIGDVKQEIKAGRVTETIRMTHKTIGVDKDKDRNNYAFEKFSRTKCRVREKMIY